MILHINAICLLILSITTIYHLYSLADITIYSFYQRITNYLIIDLSYINPFVDIVILGVGNVALILLSKIPRTIKAIVVPSIVAPIFLLYLEFYFPVANLQMAIFMLICFSMIFTGLKKRNKKKIFLIDPRLLLIYFSLCIAVLASISFLITLSYWFNFDDEVNFLRNYLYEIFLIFSTFSPILIFILLFALPIRWIIDFFSKFATISKEKILQDSLGDKFEGKLHKSIVLIFILCFSIAIVLIPHLPIVNEENKIISVDTGNYGYTIRTLINNNTIYEAVSNSFEIPFGTHPNAASGDRPFTFIFIIMLSKIVSIELDILIDIVIPMILSPILVISVYVLVKELSNNTTLSLIAAFMTTVSPQVLVGVYSGLIANWLALIIFFFAVYEIVKYTKLPKINCLISLSILLIILRFTHVYTWIVMTPIILLFTIVLILKQRDILLRKKFQNILVFSFIIVFPYLLGISLDVFYGETNFMSNITTIKSFLDTINFKNFTNSWEHLIYSVNVQNGGIIANSIILILCVGWIIYYDKFSILSLFMTVLLVSSIVPIFLGNDVIQTRMIYNIPFQVPASVTLYYLLNTSRVGKYLFISILLSLIVLSLRQVSNLIFMYY